MTRILLKPFRQLAQILVSNDTPRMVAWGFVLGMIVGLMPKGNLTAVALATLLCAIRVNMPAALLAMGLFSLVGSQFDGFAHQLGALTLTWAPVVDVVAFLYQMPFGPWLGLNNTVVVGQLLLGLYLMYPAYWVAFTVSTRTSGKVRRWLERSRATGWLRGLEYGARLGS